jgi:hypothetical protein
MRWRQERDIYEYIERVCEGVVNGNNYSSILWTL